MKKIILLVTFLVLSFSLQLFANANEVDEVLIDEFLYEIGTPSDVLDDMGYYQKLNIYNNLSMEEEQLTFDSFEIVDSSLDGSTRYIPKSELTFKVAYYKGSGNKYSVYPSFYWNGEHSVKNDEFTYALDSSSWELDASGDETLNIIWRDCIMGGFTSNESYFFDRASDLTNAGATFRIPTEWGNSSFRSVEGHSHMKVIKLNTSASNQIWVGYADVYEGKNYSVGVSFLNFGFNYNGSTSYYRSTKEKLNF